MQNMDAVFSYGLFNEVGATNDAPVIFNLGIVQSNNRFLNGDLIFDWRIGKKISDKMTLSLIVDNILNREYINRPADLGAPRTISLKLKIKS